MKIVLCFFLSLFCRSGFATIKVAFIEIRDHQGRIQQFEPGGRFAYVAISFQNQWLHAHPYRGVELVEFSSLEKIGPVMPIEMRDIPELSYAQIKDYLGKPYDATFSWEGDGHYCSELVGKLLKILPKPMHFQSPVWMQRKKNFGVGLSPDDIYKEITQPVSCQRIF